MNYIEWINSIDLEKLNLILMPLISFGAFFVYAMALRSSLKQNKISTSQSLIPYYEEQIAEILEYGNNEVIYLGESSKPEKLKCNDIWFNLKHRIDKYQTDEDYQDYLNNHLSGLEVEPNFDFTLKYYYDLDFFRTAMFSNSDKANLYLMKTRNLIFEIENSHLIKTHQKILKSKIKRLLTKSYMRGISLLDKDELVPYKKTPDLIAYETLERTHLFSYQDIFIKKLGI